MFASHAKPWETTIHKSHFLPNYLFWIGPCFPWKQSLGYWAKECSLSFFAEGLHMSGRREWKRFHLWWCISSQPTYFLQIYQLEFCLEFQWFTWNMLHNLKKDLTGRFCSKGTVNLSPAVALRFFLLLYWHCWGIVKMLSILCTWGFVKLMLSECLVAVLWIRWQ